MTAAVVFAGPSLSPQDRACRNVVFLPPAQQGDMLRCLALRPAVIGLIDGLFGTTLSVHQKEILEAMAEGTPVLGAASMGALRAAELAPYGMIGIGGIFQDYRSGRLEADADVAVTHAPAELGYRATTVAMVDLRATLEAMAPDYPADALDRIRRTAEALHFADRTLAAIARCTGQLPFDVEATLRARHVGRKRQDALELLARLQGGHLPSPGRSWVLPMTREYAAIRSRALAGDQASRARCAGFAPLQRRMR